MSHREGQPPVLPTLFTIDTRTLLAEQGPLPAGVVVRIVDEIAAELDQEWITRRRAHARITPSSIILAFEDTRLAIAGLSGFDAALNSASTRAVHEAAYVPLEVLCGEVHDHRGDQFALASTAYELLTAKPAFPGQDFDEVVLRMHDETILDPCALLPTLPAAFGPIFRTALAANPSRRYPSTCGFAAALHAAVESP